MIVCHGNEERKERASRSSNGNRDKESSNLYMKTRVDGDGKRSTSFNKLSTYYSYPASLCSCAMRKNIQISSLGV